MKMSTRSLSASKLHRFLLLLLHLILQSVQNVAVNFPMRIFLAHHLKSHVDGFKCNICGKVFESKTNLTIHLKNHALEGQLSKHSVLDNSMPNQTMSLADSIPQSKPVAPKKPHKHKSVINFSVNKWLTLK